MSPGSPGPGHGDDCRCLCGSLVARWVEGGVELKCRRCKRTLRVSLDPGVPIPSGRPARPLVVREAG